MRVWGLRRFNFFSLDMVAHRWYHFVPLWTRSDLFAPRECFHHLRGVAISTPEYIPLRQALQRFCYQLRISAVMLTLAATCSLAFSLSLRSRRADSGLQ